MKIVIVDTTIGRALLGGAQMFLVNLMPGLVSRGHEVHLVCGRPDERLSEAIESSGAVVHTDVWDGSKLVDDAAHSVADWVNKLRPDAFVVSVSPDIGWVVLPHLAPAIATLTIGHNDEETFYAPVRHCARFLTRAVGASDEIRRKYIKDCGMAASQADWIPYGVQTSNGAPVTAETGPIKLIYVGRFENVQKRISDVVAIIKKLTEAGVDFEFDLVGDGEEMPSVRSALARESVAGNVRLHGWLDSAKVIERMRSSEVFVLASAYEGFCISLTEAMANGCTPVVSDIKSGNKQLVADGENGFIVPVGDVDGFVARIRALANDRGRLSAMRIAAWETGREYSVDRMVTNYVECFERAMADAKENPRVPDPSFPLMESCRSKYPSWLRRIKARARSFMGTEA
jgi:glycosyltransferase involved in cell wall biosynthesis